jgi:hypothetical protein
MPKHYPLAPSAASRWLVCSAEPALRASVPNVSSSYAQEGTTAHWLAEQCLTSGKNCRDFIGKRCPDTDWLIPESMCEPTQIYVDHCRSLMCQPNERDVIHGSETKFTLPKVSLELGGTCDFWALRGTTLHVRDLKFGTGKPVTTKDNPQLLIYALGAYESLSLEQVKKVTSLVYGIVQPRLDDEENRIQLEKMLIGDLLTWRRSVLFPAVTATESLETEYVAGEHCWFCPGKSVCPAQHEKAQQLAQVDFAQPAASIKPVAPEALTLEQLARVLEAKDALNSWLNAIEARAQTELELGNTVPGFKLVAKRANRAWTDEAKAEVYLRKEIGDKAVSTPEVISVAQAEKALKAMKKAEMPKDLITRPDTGHIIAPLSDKRPSVTRNAVMDFCDEDFLK